MAFKLFYDALTTDERFNGLADDERVMAPLRKALRFWLDNLPFGEAADEGDRQLASTLAAYVRRYEACPETFVGELAEYDSRLNHSILFGEDLSDPNKRGERIVSLLGLGEAENARERRIITCMVPPARAPRNAENASLASWW